MAPTSLLDLPDECLDRIAELFYYLVDQKLERSRSLSTAHEERLALLLVCRRLRRAADPWLYSYPRCFDTYPRIIEWCQYMARRTAYGKNVRTLVMREGVSSLMMAKLGEDRTHLMAYAVWVAINMLLPHLTGLEHLSLCFEDVGRIEAAVVAPLMASLEGMPQLRKLDIDAPICPDIDFEHLFRILAQSCPHLTHLYFAHPYTLCNGWLFDDQTPSIPSLRYLRIIDVYFEDDMGSSRHGLPGIIACVPNLLGLHIDCMFDGSPDANALESAVRPLGQTLTSLTLTGALDTEEQLLIMLRHLPKLDLLHITGLALDRGVIANLPSTLRYLSGFDLARDDPRASIRATFRRLPLLARLGLSGAVDTLTLEELRTICDDAGVFLELTMPGL